MLERGGLGLAAEVREGDVEAVIRQALRDRAPDAFRPAGH